MIGVEPLGLENLVRRRFLRGHAGLKQKYDLPVERSAIVEGTKFDLLFHSIGEAKDQSIPFAYRLHYAISSCSVMLKQDMLPLTLRCQSEKWRHE